MPNGYRGNGLTLLSFVMIGASNACIDIGVLNVLLQLHPTSNGHLLFMYNTAAYVLAVINSYLWNSRITFSRKANFGWREKISFALQAGLALAVNNGVFLLGIRGLHYIIWWDLQPKIVYNAAKALAMLSSSACSFLMMKYIIFTSAKSREKVRGSP